MPSDESEGPGPSPGAAPYGGDDAVAGLHETCPRRRPPKRGRTGLQRAVLVLGAIAVVGLVLVASGIWYVTNKLDSIERTDVPVDVAVDESPINILVVGSDSRENVAKNDPDAQAFIAGLGGDSGKRSDTIMVVRINPKTEIIDMLSLPRDLWLPVAGSTENSRINTAYSESPQKLIETIKAFFGIEINNYVEVDFKGFKGIVDAVGGVPMYFDRPMRDTNSGLRIDAAGCTVLDGEQALAFARSRKLEYKDARTGWTTDPTADIGRIDRQQFFVRRIFDVTRQRALSPDLRVANDLLNVMTANVQVDRQMDVNRMAEIGRKFASKSSDQIKTWSLPVMQYTTADGASVVRMAADDATPILDVFRGLTPDAWPPSAIKVTIVGAAGRSGQAAQAEQAMKNIGFTVAGSSDGKTAVKRTTIRYPAGYRRMAIEVARFLANGADVVEDKTISNFTLQVSLGSDFTTTVPQARPLEEATSTPTSSTVAAHPGDLAAMPAKPTTTVPTTSSTEYVIGGDKLVGVVPGQPPPGVTC
ncbi:MAG: LCP family protein [Actinobacteria bacterium]|nr:LCP family protein [Actinomycetota bacterium]